MNELREVVDRGDVSEVVQLLEEWRATAEVHADQELHDAPAGSSAGDLGPVPSPFH